MAESIDANDQRSHMKQVKLTGGDKEICSADKVQVQFSKKAVGYTLASKCGLLLEV